MRGRSGFEFGVFLLLDGLPPLTKEPHLPCHFMGVAPRANTAAMETTLHVVTTCNLQA